MLFNSLIFLLFAALFFILLPLFKRLGNGFRLGLLVVASFFFYGWWDWRFLFLILASGMIDYAAGLGIFRLPQYRKGFLLASIIGNLGILVLFKYSGWILGNVETLAAGMGHPLTLKAHTPEFFTILPVGISFYTFQSMSYTIDVYFKRLKPTTNILLFFSYLSMFPQLVAGPIVRAKDLLPQLQRSRKITEPERWNGLKLIVIGYFKKTVLADNLAPMVTEAFSANPLTPHSGYWWMMIAAFAFQIYFDFSGYSDIARGLAKWMGFHFRLNFNHPYIATSLRDFWTRWHISLSTWFRDYVYIPLGGSRKGALMGHVNMWITMLISGLWHGANWTFVIWGGLHALYLSLERATGWPKRLSKLPGGRYLAALIVFVLVLIAWVFFRASSLSQAMHILEIMFSFQWETGLKISQDFINGRVFLILCFVIELFFLFNLKIQRLFSGYGFRYFEIGYMAVLIIACLFFRGPGSAFIYFQF